MKPLKGPRGLIAVAVLTAFALVFSGAALAAPTFPPLTGRVVDNAHILSAQAQQDLTDKLADLEAKTGHQVVVATIPDLQGYPIEDYGYQLGRAWGIGDKTRNDGVILLIAPNDRKVRIEVGYGLEPVLTDALTSRIIQAKILPDFRAGNIEQGIVAGAQSIIDQLALPEDEAKAVVAKAAEVPVRPSNQGHIPSFLVLLLAFWVISSILRGFGGRGRRHGGSLWWLPLLLLSGGRGGGGGGWGDGGGGGFSGGGGSFGGGGSSGSW
ncbi:MAG: methanol dehydrogenase [Phenylobacterium zucineum]|nr:MAG: methanol dehydrogenase [Phenylobacterium zucineum]